MLTLTEDVLREKLVKAGWACKELPVKRNQCRDGVCTPVVSHWKVVGIKGQKTVQTEGKDIIAALHSLCGILGLLNRK